MPRLRSKPVTLTALQRIQSALEQARTFRQMAESVNPAARARLLETAAHWDDVARRESEVLEKGAEAGPGGETL